MDKESLILLQELDCNCSDCKFMERDLVKRQQSVDRHCRWQKDEFDGNRVRKLKKAKFWADQGEKEKSSLLITEARKMRFQFDEGYCAIHYGNCLKFKKEIQFIPNILQLETQECFEHRRK